MPSADILLPVLHTSFALAQPALADALRRCVDDVCRRHVEQVWKYLPRSRGMDEIATKDDLPEVVEGVADALEHKDKLDQIRLLGPAHATARFGQGFSLEELIAEYVILRQSIEHCLPKMLNRPLTREEQDGLQAAMDLLVMQVVSSYTAQREAGLRLETAAMSRFLGSMAHDLRNQLNSAMLAMQMLGETGREIRQASARSGATTTKPMGQQLEQLLVDVEECRLMMDSTIQTMTRVLEAERVRSGVALKVREVALRSLLQGLARSSARVPGALAPVAGHPQSSAADVRIECSDELRIQTDPDLLSTVLANLIGNAVKYAGDQPIAVRASSPAAGRCRIEVRDAGPGIPPEMLENLFQQFHRAGRSDSGGMGLGLFIARRAADLLSARIDVQNTPGRGCVFSVDLPSPPPVPGA